MDEQHLIKNAIVELTRKGGMAWATYHHRDIFGVFDIIHVNDAGQSSYYQVSTKDHRWSRLHKIDCLRQKHTLPYASYLMLWDYSAAQFIIESL